MYRILLVDDEKIILDGLRTFLQTRYELEYYSAFSASEAIAQLRKTRIDIVVTDINMPGMNGLDLVDYIKSHWPDCRVLILTGFEVFDYAYRAHRYPYVRFMLKYEEYDEVSTVIDSFIREIECEQEHEKACALLEDRIASMIPMVRWNTVERLLRYGLAHLPQQEYDRIQLPLTPTKDVLLVCGKSLSCNDVESMTRLYNQWTILLTNILAKRSISVYTHISGNLLCFLIQGNHEDVEEEQVVYIHESLNRLFDTDKTPQISLVAASVFSPLSEIQETFSTLTHALNRIHDDGVLWTGESVNPRFTSAVVVKQLEDYYHEQNRSAFIHLLSRTLSAIQDDTSDTGREAASAAITLLFHDLSNDLDHGEWFAEYCSTKADYANCSLIEWTSAVLEKAEFLFHASSDIRLADEDSLIQRIEKLIQDNYSGELSLSWLANHLHYNASYLSRVFKERIGINITTYINDLRIGKACRLLEETDKSVREIAVAVGFYSANYFSKLFRRLKNCSPLEYRVFSQNQSYGKLQEKNKNKSPVRSN